MMFCQEECQGDTYWENLSCQGNIFENLQGCQCQEIFEVMDWGHMDWVTWIGVRSFIIRFLQALFVNGMWPVKGTRSYLYGYLSAGSNSKVDISGGSFGQDSSGISEIVDAASGTALVNTSGGTFSGAINAGSNSNVSITVGLFGKNYTNEFTPSVKVAASFGEGIANISGGNFDGGVLVYDNDYAYISSGSFGRLADPDSYSILAHVPSGPETALASILGGTFTDGLKAGRNGTIAVFGDDLQIRCPSGACYLTGTLCDGTPIHAPVYKSDNGQINLYNCLRRMAIQVDISLHSHNEGCHMILPYRILQATPDFSGKPYYQDIDVEVTGVDYDFSGPYSDIPSSTHTILLRKEVATQGKDSDEATIPVELTALHLKTVEPVDLGTPGWDGPHHLKNYTEKNKLSLLNSLLQIFSLITWLKLFLILLINYLDI